MAGVRCSSFGTLTSRAELGDLATVFKEEVVAIALGTVTFSGPVPVKRHGRVAPISGRHPDRHSSCRPDLSR
jgi:hypothetical protein